MSENYISNHNEPFFIEQCNRPHSGVSNYSFYMNYRYNGWSPSFYITAIFRVYPKGQNPAEENRNEAAAERRYERLMEGGDTPTKDQMYQWQKLK